ncbi:MAG: PAS domain S-box protein [Proteobacteria bacterium]|nr:PAS domain S-box protein [Pseudomonadota bacterium]
MGNGQKKIDPEIVVEFEQGGRRFASAVGRNEPPSVDELMEVFEHSAEGYLIHRGGKPIYLTRSLLKILGFSSEEDALKISSIFDFVHPGDRATVARHAEARQAGDDAPAEYELRLRNTDGIYTWMNCRAFPINWRGEPALAAGFFDISEKKAAERERKRLEDLFTSVFELCPMVISLSRYSDGRYLQVNKAYTELLGRSAEEVIGKTAMEIGLWKSGDERALTLQGLEVGKPILNQDLHVFHADGHLIVGEFCAARIISDDEDLVLVISWDVTEERRRQEELYASKEAAELADRTKTEFLANISHELRTPLNAVLGFAEAIRSEMFGPVGQPKYLEYADDIHKSGALLLEIINDILDLSKIEAGKMPLEEEELVVTEIVEQCVRLVRERATEAGLVIKVITKKAPARIYADRTRIKQILINLLTNAVKFTSSGGTIRLRVRSGKNGGAVFSVSDTGVGMSKLEIETALTPFGQVGSAMTRSHEGTGLGLPLAASFTEMHGGELIIESARGQGTTVSVLLPPERSVPAPASRD